MNIRKKNIIFNNFNLVGLKKKKYIFSHNIVGTKQLNIIN